MERETPIGCQDLAGHEHDLIVVGDRGRWVLVFPLGNWAALALAQVERLRAALLGPPADGCGEVPDGHLVIGEHGTGNTA